MSTREDLSLGAVPIWTYSMVKAVLDSRRAVDGTGNFRGFRNLGYIGNSDRTDYTDDLLAKALNVVRWTPAMLVVWAESKAGRWYLDAEHETLDDAAAALAEDEDDVYRWLVEV